MRPWNWQLPDWPHFYYDPKLIVDLEKKFLINSGAGKAYFDSLSPEAKRKFTIEILSD